MNRSLKYYGSLGNSLTQSVWSVAVGGDFMDNNPAVVGQTLYIGDGYGWVTALPLSHVE